MIRILYLLLLLPSLCFGAVSHVNLQDVDTISHINFMAIGDIAYINGEEFSIPDVTVPTVTSATIEEGEAGFDTIAYDTSGETADDLAEANSVTYSVTVGSNSNRVLVIGVQWEETQEGTDGDATISSVTYDGSAATHIATVEYYTDDDWMAVYYLLAPSTGANNVVVTFSETVKAASGAVSLYNVAQQAPEATNYDSGSGLSCSTNITTLTDNAWIVDIAGFSPSAADATVDSGQTARLRTKNYGVIEISTESITTAGGTASEWTFSESADWGQVVAAFKPSGTASTSLLTLNFSEAVYQGTNWADAEVLVDMSVIGNDIACAYASGNGTATWLFDTASAATEADTCYLNFDENSTGDVIENSAGDDLAAITGTSQLITNNVGGTDTAAPTVESATINGSNLYITFDEAVSQGSNWAESEVLVDLSTTGNDIACTYVTGTGTTNWQFATTSPAVYGETAYLNFDENSTGDVIEDAAGNDLAAITGTDQEISNNTPMSGYDNVFYVTQAGTDNGGSNGSETNPLSMADFNGLSGTYTNSTVFYFSGTFTGRVHVGIGGTSTAQLTLDGYKNGECNAIGNDCANGTLLADGMTVGDGDLTDEDYITVQDFRMTTSTTGNKAFSFSFPATYDYDGDDDSSFDHFLFQRNYLYNAGSSLIGWSDYGGPNKYIIIRNNKIVQFSYDTDAEQGVNICRAQYLLVQGNEFGHDDIARQTHGSSSGANMIEVHYVKNALFEYNNIYGAPEQAGISFKESNPHENIVFRYNKLHDNNEREDYAGMGTHVYGADSADMYFYGNYFYDNYYQGLFISEGGGRTVEDIYVWSNIVADNGRQGILVTELFGGSPDNIQLWNNTVVRNGDLDESDLTRSGIQLSSGTNLYSRNNIMQNNRPGGGGGYYFQSHMAATPTELQHNTYWHDTNQTYPVYYNSGLRTLSAMQGYGYENDSPAGAVRDPDFADIDNNDFTLNATSNEIDAGLDVSFGTAKEVDITNNDPWFKSESGYTTNIIMTGSEALDPDTDWTGQPSAAKILTLDRDTVGWDRGAYAYE